MATTEIKLDSQIQKAIKQSIRSSKTEIYPILGFKGLEVRIRPHKNGIDATADFRHRYTHPITKKRPYMSLGKYPAISLADAKNYHKHNESLLAKGIDPIEQRDLDIQKKISEREKTLNHYINQWLSIQDEKDLSSSTQKSNKRLVKPIQNELGYMVVSDITPSIVITFIREMQKTSPYIGLRVKSVLERILKLPLANMDITYNPASNLNGIFITPKTINKPAITDPKSFGLLLQDIDQLKDTDQFYNKRILKLLALTFVRVGDLCAMKWKDINWLSKTWEFEQQKGCNRRDMQSRLVVPLAPQTIAILKELKDLTGDNEYVFYNGRRKKDKHHHMQEVNKILNSDLMNDGQGYKNIHTPHGFRATAKTLLTERLGYDEVYTELQLGHTMLNKYGNAYNRMQGLKERTKMMLDWANYLDDLRSGKIDNIIYPDFKQSEQIKMAKSH